MTLRVEFSPEAEQDLGEIYDYLAEAVDADFARQWVERILNRCESLGDYSNRGTPRDDVRPGLRTIPFRRRATIAYVIDRNVVTILGIYAGGRDFEAEMVER
jgi:toxin ParE1/3/4